MEFGIIDETKIDEINILQATKLGLTTSVKELKTKPDVILVDALSKIDTLRNTLCINNKRRCYIILNRSSINNCKSHKGQNNAKL